jgi:hypothetical protein
MNLAGYLTGVATGEAEPSQLSTTSSQSGDHRWAERRGTPDTRRHPTHRPPYLPGSLRGASQTPDDQRLPPTFPLRTARWVRVPKASPSACPSVPGLRCEHRNPARHTRRLVQPSRCPDVAIGFAIQPSESNARARPPTQERQRLGPVSPQYPIGWIHQQTRRLPVGLAGSSEEMCPRPLTAPQVPGAPVRADLGRDPAATSPPRRWSSPTRPPQEHRAVEAAETYPCGALPKCPVVSSSTLRTPRRARRCLNPSVLVLGAHDALTSSRRRSRVATLTAEQHDQPGNRQPRRRPALQPHEPKPARPSGASAAGHRRVGPVDETPKSQTAHDRSPAGCRARRCCHRFPRPDKFEIPAFARPPNADPSARVAPHDDAASPYRHTPPKAV